MEIATVAGGLWLADAHAKIESCNFSANKAEGAGAVYFQIPKSVEINNSIFSHCSATQTGGALLFAGTPQFSKTTNCVFADNDAINARAILNGQVQTLLEIKNSTFVRNTGTATIENSTDLTLTLGFTS